MRDPFETIADGMSVVVHWVDTPLVSDVRMGTELDAIDDWISEGGIGVLVVDFSSQR